MRDLIVSCTQNYVTNKYPNTRNVSQKRGSDLTLSALMEHFAQVLQLFFPLNRDCMVWLGPAMEILQIPQIL